MEQRSAYRTMARTLAASAGLGMASFVYTLCICGSSSAGVTFALAMTLFVFGMSVWAGVTVFLE